MKFLQVTFGCFGPFEERTLDLAGDAGLHVIFGKNEAGKSSALRGILAFLFGFRGQSTDDFRFKYNQFRVRAQLESAAGHTLECIRRKGNKDTLRMTCDKVVVPDRQLTDFLKGMDENQFEQLFGLNADRLREGGHTIASGEGELGEALFAAGAGMKELRILSRRLEERQAALYLPSGRKQRITEALREYRDQTEQARKLALSPDTFVDAEAAAASAREKVKELTQERVAARTRLTLLNRYQSALPTIDLLRTVRERLESVSDAPLLSDDFDAKLEHAREKHSAASTELAHLRSDERKLAELRKTEQPSALALGEEGEISELKKLVGADAKLREEEVKAETFSIDERGKARDIYRELTGTTDWERMDGLKPRLDERNRIVNLANERSAVVEQFNRQETTVWDAKRLLKEAENKQSASPLPADPLRLQDAVDEIMRGGPLEDQLARFANDVQTEERRLADDFARFNPVLAGTWRESPAQPVPLHETVESFRDEFDTVRATIAKIAEQKAGIEEKITEIRGSLIDKIGTEPVPTADELAVARGDRDSGMFCLRQRLAGQADELSEVHFTARHAAGRSLIDAAERSIRHCDTLADRLRHEAERVALYQSLQQMLIAFQERLETLACADLAAKNDLAAIEKRWQTAWQPCKISADLPKRMHVWLANCARFVERVTVWQANSRKCDEIEQQIGYWRTRLSQLCPATVDTKTLAEGLLLAKRSIAEVMEARSRVIRLAEDVRRLQVAAEKAENDEAIARARLNEWETQWSQAVDILGLRSPSIETALDYLKRIDQMQQHLRDMRLKEARVREIRKDRELLIQRINASRQRLDSTSRPTTAESFNNDFREIEAVLQTALAQRTRHQEVSKQLAEVEKRLGRAQKSLDEASVTLRSLAAEAGVEVDAIPAAVQRARERAGFTAQIRQYEEALAQNALGEPIEKFMASALTQRGQVSQPNLDELGRQLNQLDPKVSEAEARANEADRVLADFSAASGAAAEAKQNVAHVGARLQDLVIEYAGIHLARTALERAKERYRARHQDTLLDRSGAFFRDLTDGAFSGVDIDNEDGLDILKAVRVSTDRPDARVSVSGLSDGTRDQLFLALRLAGIELHLTDESHEPMPLIVDDVLVNFDDVRARATLGCLAKFARKTQVLIFTHHRHLVDLARAVEPTTVVHDLALGRPSSDS